MPPKRGQKRKACGSTNADRANGEDVLAPPDPNSWPGWVEMESEPAFFNVMLKDMGVRGVKIQEVWSIEDDMLAALPQPVHALIFLFRYHTADEADNYTGTEQDHIWFANQVPDFACASVALLNIVNNIPGLHMGQELRNFKDFTKDMDPLSRGDAIDSFDFVKRIHNSFARENDLLTADAHLQEKHDKWKRKQSAAKGRATKAAKRAAQEETPLKEKSANAATKKGVARPSTRAKKGTATPSSKASTPTSKPTYSAESTPEPRGDDDEFAPGARKAKTKAKANAPAPRRSARAPKPRKKDVYESEAEEPTEGFHFIAYMPIDGRVWKLDGLDYYPHDMGSPGVGGDGADERTGNWMQVVAPAIQNRMLQFEGAEINFNLMAVVHDPAVDDRNELLENVKILQAVELKLNGLFEDWRSLEGAETKKEVVTGISDEYDMVQPDVDAVELPTKEAEEIAKQEDFMELIRYRQSAIAKQGRLRAAVRDARLGEKDDDEKARHRRHDYGAFARKWLGTLAEQEVLGDLING